MIKNTDVSTENPSSVQNLFLNGRGVGLRIPLYSITDWHRSPINDSHLFDQPGT